MLLPVAVSGCRKENNSESSTEIQLLNTEIDSLNTELERQEKQNDSLQQALQTDIKANDYSVFFGKEWEDIKSPEAHITESLKQQENIIPLTAVLGGTMEFRRVQVISEDWVLAIYDDGHVQGKSIFAYELQEDQQVKFTEIATRLPQ